MNPCLKFFDGVDVFIHLAALMPSSKINCSDYYHCNSVAAKSLFDLCSQIGVSQFVYLSGSNILKPVDGIVTTQSHYSSILRHPAYLSSKMAGELLLLNTSSPTKLTVLRPSSVYGHGVRSGLFRNLYDSFLRRSTITLSCNGLWSADFVYAGDVARVILRLIEDSLSGVFNIGSGESCSVYEVVQKFQSFFQVDDDLIVLQPFDDSLDTLNPLPVVSIDQYQSLMGHSLFL